MDKIYWRNFYNKHKINVEPSLFAKFIYDNYLLGSTNTDSTGIKDTKSNALSLLELGCGNGRDSLYFAINAIDVIAIDQVQEEIEFLNNYIQTLIKNEESLQDNKRKTIQLLLQDMSQRLHKQSVPHFLAGDFTQLDNFGFRRYFDCIYSRFTLHSISKVQQDKTLANCLKYCKKGGILAIEARGEKNSLCGRGKAIDNEPNAFIYDEHYRRFLNFEQTLREIKSLRFNPNDTICSPLACDTGNTSNNTDAHNNLAVGGGGGTTYCFKILYAMEDNGFAPFNGEDDYFIRIVAKKESCGS